MLVWEKIVIHCHRIIMGHFLAPYRYKEFSLRKKSNKMCLQKNIWKKISAERSPSNVSKLSRRSLQGQVSYSCNIRNSVLGSVLTQRKFPWICTYYLSTTHAVNTCFNSNEQQFEHEIIRLRVTCLGFGFDFRVENSKTFQDKLNTPRTKELNRALH